MVWYDTANPQLHTRMLEVEYVDADTFDLFFMDGTVVPYATANAGGTFTMRRRYSVTTTFTESELRDITFAQDNDVMYLAHVNHPPSKLSRRGTQLDAGRHRLYPERLSTYGAVGVVTHGTGHDPALAETYYYKCVISSETGEESLPTLQFSLTTI